MLPVAIAKGLIFFKLCLKVVQLCVGCRWRIENAVWICTVFWVYRAWLRWWGRVDWGGLGMWNVRVGMIVVGGRLHRICAISFMTIYRVEHWGLATRRPSRYHGLGLSQRSALLASRGLPFGMTFLSNWDSLLILINLKLNLKLIFLLRVNHSHLSPSESF